MPAPTATRASGSCASRASPSLATALDLGLQECRAELVARFDADDICEPHRLELQVGALNARPELAVLGSAATVIDASGTVCGLRQVPVGVGRVRRRLLWHNCILHPSVMFRREVVKAIGGYDARMDRSEDYDLWMRVLAAGDLDNVHEPLIRLREHPGQLSRRYKLRIDSLRSLQRSRHAAAAPSRRAQTLAKVQDVAEIGSWVLNRFRR